MTKLSLKIPIKVYNKFILPLKAFPNIPKKNHSRSKSCKSKAKQNFLKVNECFSIIYNSITRCHCNETEPVKTLVASKIIKKRYS